MRAKSLKSSQILRAHMPYFRRPGHKFLFIVSVFCIVDKEWTAKVSASCDA